MIETLTKPFSTLYAKLKDQPHNTYKEVREEYRKKYNLRSVYNLDAESLANQDTEKRKRAFNSEWSLILKSLHQSHGYVIPRQTKEEAKAVLKANRPTLKNVKRADWLND